MTVSPVYLFITKILLPQHSSLINVIVRRYAKGKVYLFHGGGTFHEIVFVKLIITVQFWIEVVAGKCLEVIE